MCNLSKCDCECGKTYEIRENLDIKTVHAKRIVFVK